MMGVNKVFHRRGLAKEQEWNSFAEHVQYIQADYDDPSLYERLIHLGDTSWGEATEYHLLLSNTTEFIYGGH